MVGDVTVGSCGGTELELELGTGDWDWDWDSGFFRVGDAQPAVLLSQPLVVPPLGEGVFWGLFAVVLRVGFGGGTGGLSLLRNSKVY